MEYEEYNCVLLSLLASAEEYLLNEDIKWKDKEINLMVLLSFGVLCTSGPLKRGHCLDDREATTALLFHFTELKTERHILLLSACPFI